MVHGDAIQLTGLAGSSLIGFLLVLSRVGGLFVLAPGFSSRMIPARVKFVMAVAISLALTPVAMHGHPVGQDAGDLAMLIVKELMVGLAFALPLAIVAAGKREFFDEASWGTWQEIQRGLTALSTRSTFTLASQSAHHVEFGQPEAVVAAVRGVVGEARGWASGTPSAPR